MRGFKREERRLFFRRGNQLRERGARFSAVDAFTTLDALRSTARAELDRTSAYDAVLTPTLAQPPAAVGALRDDADPARDFDNQKRFTPFTAPYNPSGQPAITLPLHWTDDELPIGVQLVGRPGDEVTLLALAAQLEAAAPWSHRRPAPVTRGGCWPSVPTAAGDVPYLDRVERSLNRMLADEAQRGGAIFVDDYSGGTGHDQKTAGAHGANPMHPTLASTRLKLSTPRVESLAGASLVRRRRCDR